MGSKTNSPAFAVCPILSTTALSIFAAALSTAATTLSTFPYPRRTTVPREDGSEPPTWGGFFFVLSCGWLVYGDGREVQLVGRCFCRTFFFGMFTDLGIFPAFTPTGRG